MNTEEKKYTVAVVATMSAGKSTLLNAMVGFDLLPTKNLPCTSTIFRIEDHDEIPNFEGLYRDNRKLSEWQAINQEILSDWNGRGFQEIEIRGNLPGIKNSENACRVVFFDTPGPNNAMSSDHEKITKKIIRRADFCNLICVLNASVMGVQDEWKLLAFIKKEIDKAESKIRPIFVLNKIDVLDYDSGERVGEIVRSATDYLKSLGYKNPIVIPMCSMLSLTIRKCLNGATRMTAKEVSGDYRGAAKLKSFFSRRYKSTLSERKQFQLKIMLQRFNDLCMEYRSALEINPTSKKALENLEKIKRPTPRRKIKIAGTYFKYSELYQSDQLAGVPVLEYILEQKLNTYSKKH